MAGGSVRIVRIKFKNAGFNAVRKSPGVRAELAKRGHAIADAAGGSPDFAVIESESKSRARVVVTTASVAGMSAEATDRALTQALGAGRG